MHFHLVQRFVQDFISFKRSSFLFVCIFFLLQAYAKIGTGHYVVIQARPFMKYPLHTSCKHCTYCVCVCVRAHVCVCVYVCTCVRVIHQIVFFFFFYILQLYQVLYYPTSGPSRPPPPPPPSLSLSLFHKPVILCQCFI